MPLAVRLAARLAPDRWREAEEARQLGPRVGCIRAAHS